MKKHKPGLRSFATILLLSASFSFASSARADDFQAQPIKVGEPAPFTGQLLTDSLAIQLGLGVEHCREKAGLKLRQVGELCAEQKRNLRALEAIRVSALVEKQKVLQIELDEALRASTRGWWEDPVFVGSLAFSAGVLLTVGLGVGLLGFQNGG